MALRVDSSVKPGGSDPGVYSPLCVLCALCWCGSLCWVSVKSDHLVRMFSQDESLSVLICTLDILKASTAGDYSSWQVTSYSWYLKYLSTCSDLFQCNLFKVFIFWALFLFLSTLPVDISTPLYPDLKRETWYIPQSWQTQPSMSRSVKGKTHPGICSGTDSLRNGWAKACATIIHSSTDEHDHHTEKPTVFRGARCSP